MTGNEIFVSVVVGAGATESMVRTTGQPADKRNIIYFETNEEATEQLIGLLTSALAMLRSQSATNS